MLHEITALAPKNDLPKRKGRGESSGMGKTSGRGNKGAKARVGKYVKRGHEHGQTPIYRRLPKRGFSNAEFARHHHIVNLADLEIFDAGSTVDASVLKEKGLIPDTKYPVKILGEGKLTKKLTITASRFSKSAFEQLNKLGATLQNLKGEAYQLPKVKKKFVLRPKAKKTEETPAAPAAEAKAE
ncbi:MAG TPA: 50S ribosomal protein L15 [Tepidisphaeraceae bacterium]|jgi:large subunit ribosomal protein L15